MVIYRGGTPKKVKLIVADLKQFTFIFPIEWHMRWMQGMAGGGGAWEQTHLVTLMHKYWEVGDPQGVVVYRVMSPQQDR